MAEIVLDTTGMTDEQIEAWCDQIDLANEYHQVIRDNEGEAIALDISILKGGWKNNLRKIGRLLVITEDTAVLKGKVNTWAKTPPTVLPKPVKQKKKKKNKKKKGK